MSKIERSNNNLVVPPHKKGNELKRGKERCVIFPKIVMRNLMMRDSSVRWCNMTRIVMKSFVFVVLLGSCASPTARSYITFVLGDVHVDNALVSAPQQIVSAVKIHSGPDALAVIQLGDAIKCIVRSAASLTYGVNTSSGVAEIQLKTGSIAAQLSSRNAQLKVYAYGNMVDAGEGAFDIAGDGTALMVNVFEGNIVLSNNNEQKTIHAGERFEWDGNQSYVRKLTPQERRLYTLLKKVNMIDARIQEGGLLAGDVVPSWVAVEILSLTPRNISETLSLEALARKEGPLSMITTRQGKRITGHLRARGKLADITTREGTVTLPQKDIVSVSPYSALR